MTPTITSSVLVVLVKLFGMVQAWVGHFVTPLKCTYEEYNWQVMSQNPHKKHKQHDKHHYNGGGAARPSSGVDLMNPCRLRGGRPCACLSQCRRRSDLTGQQLLALMSAHFLTSFFGDW